MIFDDGGGRGENVTSNDKFFIFIFYFLTQKIIYFPQISKKKLTILLGKIIL